MPSPASASSAAASCIAISPRSWRPWKTPSARFVLTIHSKPKAVLIGAEAFLGLLRGQTPADRLLALQLGALVQGDRVVDDIPCHLGDAKRTNSSRRAVSLRRIQIRSDPVNLSPSGRTVTRSPSQRRTATSFRRPHPKPEPFGPDPTESRAELSAIRASGSTRLPLQIPE